MLAWIQLQQRLGQVEGGDQVIRCHRQRLAKAFDAGGQGPGDHQQAPEAAEGKGVPRLQIDGRLQGLPCF